MLSFSNWLNQFLVQWFLVAFNIKNLLSAFDLSLSLSLSFFLSFFFLSLPFIHSFSPFHSFGFIYFSTSLSFFVFLFVWTFVSANTCSFLLPSFVLIDSICWKSRFNQDREFFSKNFHQISDRKVEHQSLFRPFCDLWSSPPRITDFNYI